jgi:hypothetical protein
VVEIRECGLSQDLLNKIQENHSSEIICDTLIHGGGYHMLRRLWGDCGEIVGRLWGDTIISADVACNIGELF